MYTAQDGWRIFIFFEKFGHLNAAFSGVVGDGQCFLVGCVYVDNVLSGFSSS